MKNDEIKITYKNNINELVEFSKTLKVLLVEDNKESRIQTIKLLENLFTDITVGVDGIDGLDKFNAGRYDLIISDINMPNMDGIEMCRKIREISKDIPIIILSAHNYTKYFMDTIRLGINGYILKPVNLNQFINTLNEVIEKIKLRDEVHIYKRKLESLNNDLEAQVCQRISEIYTLNQEIKDTQKEVIFTMGTIGEIRSKETGNHVKRVALYSEILAKHYGLDDKEVEMLKEASPMHDIGKVAIPDAILNKTEKLTIDEKAIMDTHTTLGYEMFKYSNRELLKMAAVVSYEHHEKYDGSGYPRGLKGDDISIYGRITALSDVFDALGSSRVYKPAWEDEKIFKMFKAEGGKHFDPKLVDIFFDNLDEFLSIRDSLK